MAVLRELTGGRDHPLRGKVTLIGRDAGCDVVVRTDQTSSRHAIIVQSGDSYYIEDLESVNGVCVNGVRIHQRTPLRPGDRVEIPGLAALFQAAAPAEITPVETAALRSDHVGRHDRRRPPGSQAGGQAAGRPRNHPAT